ncbi:MAG: hypothetical protein WD771_02385 [Gemmatimonadaceae bacterium]
MLHRFDAPVRVLRTDRTIPRIVRRFRAVGVVVAALALSACYTSVAQPVTAPLVEERAEFVVSDEGRVALRGQLGAGARTVEGRVVRQDDSSWTLRVYRLTTISGDAFTWMGETVELPMSSVSTVARRSLDRRATALAAVAVTGAVVAYMWSRGLFGGGFETAPTDPPPPPVDIRR